MPGENLRLSMILSENRYPLFGIMLYDASTAGFFFRRSGNAALFGQIRRERACKA
jgi:hypothetical protein